MSRKFYIISIGPGDPELITIKALRALALCDVIFVPARTKTSGWEGLCCL
ncbi:MAG: SAM-dependent methyltransferase [Bacillus subtilis]|nr:SAM-dependent methyltransferase [Bacillus subtilis]